MGSLRGSYNVMLINFGVIGSAGGGEVNFYNMIESFNGTSDLQFCVDAGSKNSYDPSVSSSLRDLSGNNNHFSPSASLSFNGSTGGLSSSEYFSADSNSQTFTLSNSQFAFNWHRTNNQFTLAGVLAFPATNSPVGIRTLMSTARTITTGTSGAYVTGMAIELIRSWTTTQPRKMSVSILHGWSSSENGSSARYSVPQTPTDNLIFVAISRRSDSLIFRIGDIVNSQSAFNPSSLADDPNGTTINLPYSGDRLYTLAGWSRGLSTTELDSLYTALQERYTELT